MQDLAVFFDRDDTLLRASLDCRYYITRPDEINPVQGVCDALRKLSAVHAKLFVVTNQNCISAGIMSSMAVATLNDIMVAGFAEKGIVITSVAFAHGNKSPYDKAQAKGELIAGLRRIHCPEGLLEHCWMVGDRWDDMKAGKIAVCRTIHLWYPDSFILDYVEDEEIQAAAKVMRGPKPDIENGLADYFAGDMEEVAHIILSMSL
jgi:histidinol-phosphate phosphatase family protein